MSEYNTDEQNREARRIRLNNFDAIIKEQFQMRYFGNIEYSATENMSVLERTSMFNCLSEQKKAERKAKEEALKKAKESSRSRRGWHRH